MIYVTYIIIALLFVFGISYAATETSVPAFFRGVALALLTCTLALCFYQFDRTDQVRDYLNGKIEVDTIAISPKGELLEIELKYK